MNNILYLLIFGFGGILLIYTLIRFFTTQKKISERETSLDKTTVFFSRINKKIKLWHYYFVSGDNSNLMMRILLSLVIFFIFYAINVAYIRMENMMFFILYIILFIVIVWKFGQRKNRKMFDDTFPEVIQILNSASSSGAGLLQALERCGQDISGSLGDEFKLIYKRLAIGEDPISVFEDSYTRYPYKEFYFFITIIRTNLSKGGQMREVISRLGRVIADSKKMEQKKKAMTSEARMSAMIVSSFPVFFFLFMKFMMPENFEFLINDPTGRIVLYYVFGSELFGMFIIWWLMRKST